jgi:hypothetical protein
VRPLECVIGLKRLTVGVERPPVAQGIAQIASVADRRACEAAETTVGARADDRQVRAVPAKLDAVYSRQGGQLLLIDHDRTQINDTACEPTHTRRNLTAQRRRCVRRLSAVALDGPALLFSAWGTAGRRMVVP